MSSYTGTADRPDRAKAIAAVVAVHAALAAIILAGLNVRVVSHVVEQLKTFDIRLPPPPPPLPPPPATRPHQMKKPQGAPAKKAEATPVVAPPPQIAASLADPGGQDRRHRKRHDVGRGNIRNRHRRRRLGQRPGRRRRLFAVHAGAAGTQPHPGRLRAACRRPPPDRPRDGRLAGRAERSAEQLPGDPVERRWHCRRRAMPVDRATGCASARRATTRAGRSLPGLQLCRELAAVIDLAALTTGVPPPAGASAILAASRP